MSKNQLLLRLLRLRVIVNGQLIYDIRRDKPVVIDIPTNPSRLVLTDGFHITSPIEVNCSVRQTNFYKVGCVIENDQLLVGWLITMVIYAMGVTSGMVLLQLLSIAPVLYFLFLYYIKRKEFIRLLPV